MAAVIANPAKFVEFKRVEPSQSVVFPTNGCFWREADIPTNGI